MNFRHSLVAGLTVLFLTAFFAAMGPGSGQAAQSAWPERPVTVFVGFAPGGSMDLSARALAASAEKLLGQPVVVENKPGGTGAVALSAMLSHKHDGYVLCATPSSVLIRVSQLQALPFKPLTAFRPILGYAEPQLGIVVRGDSSVKTLAALVQEAKASPGKLNYATTGVGSTTQAAVEEIVAKEKLEIIHVPYKGSMEALTALLGGHVDFAALTSELVPAVKAGQIRLLAVISEKRSPKYPDIPTLREQGYDFSNDAIFAVVAPADLDPGVAGRLEQVFTAATKDPDYLKTLDRINMVPVLYNGRAYSAFLREQWRVINRHLIASGVIKEAATQPE